MPGDSHHEKSPRRVALVTGGAVRVGRAIALRLARDGMDVAITYRGSQDEAQGTVGDLRGLGVQAEAFQVDLADAAEAARLPAAVAEGMTRLDVVVNSASVFYRTPVGGVVADEWEDLFAVNAKGPFFVAQAAVPYLKYDDPSIVNILDVSALSPWPGYIPYAASKAALQAVTVGLAKALAPQVRVNAVAPGPVLAPQDYDDAQRKRASDATLLKRWGTPDDVAAAVAYLVSSTYTTGVVLPVDGGRHIA